MTFIICYNYDLLLSEKQMSALYGQAPELEDLQTPDAHEDPDSGDGTAAAAVGVSPPGALPDDDPICPTTSISCDTLDGVVAHALADMPSAISCMPSEAVDGVGSILDHLVNTTNLFDVPPFDLDGSGGC